MTRKSRRRGRDRGSRRCRGSEARAKKWSSAAPLREPCLCYGRTAFAAAAAAAVAAKERRRCLRFGLTRRRWEFDSSLACSLALAS